MVFQVYASVRPLLAVRDTFKPVVRIDLVTGTTDEMETYRAFEVNPNGRLLSSLVSPHGCRVVSVTSSVIYCYDVRTGKATLTRNKFEDIPSTRGRQLFISLPAIWTGGNGLPLAKMARPSDQR